MACLHLFPFRPCGSWHGSSFVPPGVRKDVQHVAVEADEIVVSMLEVKMIWYQLADGPAFDFTRAIRIHADNLDISSEFDDELPTCSTRRCKRIGRYIYFFKVAFSISNHSSNRVSLGTH